jgi:hypothetical protein
MRVVFTFPLLLAGLLSLVATPAWAEPRCTDFKDVIAQSATIAIVTLLDLPSRSPILAKSRSFMATLDVLKVLKGNLKPGTQKVRFADYPHGAAGEFVAFIDKAGIWKFTAAPLNATSVESDVLVISGFYDWNAHFVTPGFLTLAQLKTYLKDGSLLYTFRGHVWFPQPGKPSWKPSALRIDGTYNAVSNSAHVIGFDKLAGFPAEPKVHLTSFFPRKGACLDLEYSRRGDRPLEIMGNVEGVDQKSRAILARFAITSPDVLTKASLDDYLADSRRGHCYYACRLHCDPTKNESKTSDLVLTLEKESGTIGHLEGWGNAPLEVDGMEHIENLFAGGQVLKMVIPTKPDHDLILAFDLGRPSDGKDTFRWTFQNELLYCVYTSPVHGTLQLRDGKKLRTIRTFSVTLDPVAFAPKNAEK